MISFPEVWPFDEESGFQQQDLFRDDFAVFVHFGFWSYSNSWAVWFYSSENWNLWYVFIFMTLKPKILMASFYY